MVMLLLLPERAMVDVSVHVVEIRPLLVTVMLSS